MFQQPEKYFNGQPMTTPEQMTAASQMVGPDPCTSGHGMGWQPNDYGMTYDIPSTSSSYDMSHMTTGYQANWMATIQNPSSPDPIMSQTSSPTYQNPPIPQFNQSETPILPPITSQHQPFNDGVFKTPDSSVFSIKRERSHSTPNTANEQNANISSRGTLNKSRRTQPCKFHQNSMF